MRPSLSAQRPFLLSTTVFAHCLSGPRDPTTGLEVLPSRALPPTGARVKAKSVHDEFSRLHFYYIVRDCVSVCVYVCAYICVHVSVCACMYVCMYVCTCECVCMRDCICMCVCICVHMCECVCMCVYEYVCI